MRLSPGSDGGRGAWCREQCARRLRPSVNGGPEVGVVTRPGLELSQRHGRLTAMQFRVLGPLEVTCTDGISPVLRPQQRRVLAALLVHVGAVVSTDRLLAILWGDELPASALKSLHTHVSRLRQALGDEAGVLVTRPSGYVLAANAERTDAGLFARLLASARTTGATRPATALAALDEALALWRGPAYADFADEAFVRAEVARLEELRLAATEARFDLLLTLGRHNEVVGDVDTFTRAHPLREHPQAQLMIALYRCGRQSEALERYRAFRDMIADELGLLPSVTLRTLERDMLQQRPELDWSPDTTTVGGGDSRRGTDLAAGASDDAAPAATREGTNPPAMLGLAGLGATPELLERSAQRDTLEELFASVRTLGEGRVALISGEAGVGKTEVIRRFCSEHRDQAAIMWGACDALFTPRPLGPLRDIAEATGGQLGALVNQDAQPYDIAAALLRELASSRVVVLVLEDLNWADEATIDVVRLLARRVTSVPALVLASYRDDELNPGHPLQNMLGELATHHAISAVELSTLSSHAVAQLARHHRVDPDELHRVTGGNPFFVSEALAAAGEGVPRTVRDAVLARAARLSPAARSVLEAVAIAPPRIELWLLDEILAGAAEHVDACLASGIIVADAVGVAYRHELARLAVDASIMPHRRVRLHRGALQALSRAGSLDVSRLAHHAAGAHAGKAVLEFAPLAAEQAARVGAHREAAAHYQRLLQFVHLLPVQAQADILQRHANECYLTDDHPAAIAGIERALALYRQIGDRRQEGNALRLLSELLWCPGRTVEAAAAGHQAAALLEPLTADRAFGLALSNIARLYLNAEDVDNTVAWSTRALRVARKVDDRETEIHARTNLATIACLTGAEDGFEQLEQCRHFAQQAGSDIHVARAMSNTAMCALRRHDFAQADRALRAGIAFCRERGQELHLYYLRAYQAVSHLKQGRWTDAVDAADFVVRYPRGSTLPRTVALVVVGLVEARRGSAPPWGALDEAASLATQTGEPQRVVPVAAARAEAAWLDERADAIMDETDGALALATRTGDPWMIGELVCWRWRAGGRDRVASRMADPYMLTTQGKPALAAQGWARLGCPYEAALAQADADDQDARGRARQQLHDLGATATEQRVTNAL